MRLKYVMSEVLVGLWRNVTMTIAMIITMAVSLTMLGASGLMFLQVNSMKDFYYSKIEVAMFLTQDATQEQKDSLAAKLKSDPLVKDYIFESRSEAYVKFKDMYRDAPDLVGAVNENQLPESYRVRLRNPEQFTQIYDKYKGAEGIDQIIDQRKLLDKVFKILASVRNLALGAAGIMALAALLLVANTIQVAAYSKRREVAVMKLVGASNWFIQAPFVLEAMVAGLIGSILAFALLAIFKWLLLDGSLRDLTNLLTQIEWSSVLLMFPVMAGVGCLVSAITAWVTLRFYLRV